jgi:hypothetical protein
MIRLPEISKFDYLYRFHVTEALPKVAEVGLSTYCPRQIEIARAYPNLWNTDSWPGQISNHTEYRLYLLNNLDLAVSRRTLLRFPRDLLPSLSLTDQPQVVYCSSGSRKTTLVSPSAIDVFLSGGWVNIERILNENFRGSSSRIAFA